MMEEAEEPQCYQTLSSPYTVPVRTGKCGNRVTRTDCQQRESVTAYDST